MSYSLVRVCLLCVSVLCVVLCVVFVLLIIPWSSQTKLASNVALEVPKHVSLTCNVDKEVIWRVLWVHLDRDPRVNCVKKCWCALCRCGAAHKVRGLNRALDESFESTLRWRF